MTALLARTQLGGEHASDEDDTCLGEMVLMGVGALFLGFNVAPTEEMILISYQMTEWRAVAPLVVLPPAVSSVVVLAVVSVSVAPRGWRLS